MDHDDDGETSYNTFVDDVAFEPTYSQALLTAAGRNVATLLLLSLLLFGTKVTNAVSYLSACHSCSHLHTLLCFRADNYYS